MPNADDKCPIHGKKYWIPSIHPGLSYCQQCSIDENHGHQLGDMTGDRHNGAGCYDHDSDFSQ